jgi:hypothetical protein
MHTTLSSKTSTTNALLASCWPPKRVRLLQQTQLLCLDPPNKLDQS